MIKKIISLLFAAAILLIAALFFFEREITFVNETSPEKQSLSSFPVESPSLSNLEQDYTPYDALEQLHTSTEARMYEGHPVGVPDREDIVTNELELVIYNDRFTKNGNGGAILTLKDDNLSCDLSDMYGDCKVYLKKIKTDGSQVDMFEKNVIVDNKMHIRLHSSIKRGNYHFEVEYEQGGDFYMIEQKIKIR